MTKDAMHEAIESVLANYHQGLVEGQPEKVLEALGDSLFMFNGNSSGDPKDWQAHMFLSKGDLRLWPALFLKEAGPYENQFSVVQVSIRGEAAVVVTEDTGRNKFRAWENELTTWLLGQVEGRWKIFGYFVRDLGNPA